MNFGVYRNLVRKYFELTFFHHLPGLFFVSYQLLI